MTGIYNPFLSRYSSFTEIQQIAIPIIEKGNNCIVVAPTGAGKTEAVVLPLISLLSKSGELTGIKVIYITPLRALNRDMIKRLTWICEKAGMSISVRHGDTLQSERRKQEKIAPIFLITTPETLQSILPTKSFAQHLRNVEFVVVDEVHELYYNKRGAQLSIALERLEEVAPGFKRIGISATVADPETAGRFICGQRPFEVAIVKPGKKTVLDIELPRRYNKEIKDLGSKLDLDDKSMARLGAIANGISKSKSTLVFANTRQVVEALGSRLMLLNKMHDFGGIGVHHGSLDRKERIDMEDRFKDGRIKSIIATSSLELGIDIGNVDLVIQYGSPRQALRLVQRVGRSGHSVAGTSRGLVVATSSIDAIEAAAIYKNAKLGIMEGFGICEGALDVLCNQVCGVALDKKEIPVGSLLGLVRRAYPYRNTQKADLEGLLEFMNKQRLVWFDGKTVLPSSKTRMYYYEHLSVIPNTKKFVVKSVIDNRIISTLDERFVVANIEEGSVFIVKGLPWRVVSIDENFLSVEPSEHLDAAVPDWVGEDIPVSYKVSREVMSLVGDLGGLQKLGCMDKETLDQVSEFAKAQQKFGTQSRDVLVVERVEDYIILHTGLGTMANEAFSRLLTYLITTLIGKSMNVRSTPYFIMFDAPRNVKVESFINKINVGSLEHSLEESIKDTDLFRYRFMNIAKLFGVVDKGAAVSKSLAKRIIRVLKDTPVYKETIRDIMAGFDLVSLGDFVSGVQSGRIKVVEAFESSMSPIADEILNAAYYTRELMMPVAPSKALLDSFSEFMLKKEIHLMCTYCGFTFARKLIDIKDANPIECPSCGSVMICRNSELHSDVVKKRLNGKRLGKEDRRVLEEVLKETGLFSSYGGKAAMALSTYGVGPSSAARALLMHRKEESLFYKDLIEAQKQFIRTKKYWSV